MMQIIVRHQLGDLLRDTMHSVGGSQIRKAKKASCILIYCEIIACRMELDTFTSRFDTAYVE